MRRGFGGNRLPRGSPGQELSGWTRLEPLPEVEVEPEVALVGNPPVEVQRPERYGRLETRPRGEVDLAVEIRPRNSAGDHRGVTVCENAHGGRQAVDQTQLAGQAVAPQPLAVAHSCERLRTTDLLELIGRTQLRGRSSAHR